MDIAVITGAAGLIGSEAARFFSGKGFRIIGIDNDMRSYFFGEGASTRAMADRLSQTLPYFENRSHDIRDEAAVSALFSEFSSDIRLVIHAAAQPSHDWAAREPATDFTINANGTLNLLEATRKHAPKAVFIFTSTNKVYGDRPNSLPLEECETRWEIAEDHPYFARGIDESMSIDNTLHSIFGASKVAADVLVQEYGKYFEMKTGIFRGGCLTGPAHSGAELHGFLAYLMQCAISGARYRIYGYRGKQVRDNIHSYDLVNAFHHFYTAPRCGEVYNIGGSRYSNCSMLEAISLCEEISGNVMNTEYVESNRIGDHIWWISDVGKFRSHYPSWELTRDVRDILTEIHAARRGQAVEPVTVRECVR
ncbi:MAG TPA: NAD-dependent epimerase/dehydratase family protein [Thermoanaerobaculia bacterium]|nr:NAD-dependent epimerase/dehydratase family protein [Thermoanaerobaculia bacterium]